MSIKNTPDKYSSDTSFGQGELAEYVPHLNVRKVSRPNARSNRPPCWKTGRHHEFLSDGEERYFLYLLWAEDVVDIREQFPLDIEETIEIAKSMGVRHPANKEEKVTMTTDFVITLRDGSVVARTYKNTDALSNKRNLEKLGIEKAYWESKGVDCKIVHEKLIDRVVADNISTFNECREFICKNSIPDDCINMFMSSIRNNPSELAAVCDKFDENFNFEAGTSINIFSNLVAYKQLKVDMFKPFSAFMKCSDILFVEVEK